MTEKSRRRIASCSVGLIVLTGAVSVFAADSPAMFRGDPAHRGDYGAAGIKRLVLKWRVSTGGKVRSSPAVAGDLVLVGSEDGHLYAVDRATGAVAWKYRTRGPVTSSPASAAGKVFVVGGGGDLHALRLASGELLWRFEIQKPLQYEQREGDPRTWDFYLGSPVVHRDTVLFGAADGAVYALDAVRGTQRWKRTIGGPVRSTPAVAGDTVYVGSMEGEMHALRFDNGQPRWVFDTEGNPYFPLGEIQSSPAVADGLVFFGARDGFLYAVDAGTGEQRWQFNHQGSWVITSPAVSGGLVLAGSSDGQFVHAVNAETGTEKWRFDVGARVFSSPAVAGGLVYFGSWNGDLFGLDVRNGSRKAVNMAESAIMSSPALARGVLYVGSDDSCLYAFTGVPYDPALETKAIRLTPEQLESLTGTYREADGSTYRVTVVGDHLSLDTGMQKLEMFPASDTEFFFHELDLKVRFVTGDSGSVTRIDFVSGETITPAPRLP